MIVLVRSPWNRVWRISDAVAVAVEAVVVGPDVAEEAGEVVAYLRGGGIPEVSPVGPGVIGVIKGIEVDGVFGGDFEANA